MKITIVMGFFLPVPPAAGGATEKSWHGLAREFAAAGHEVTVISREWPDWPNEQVIDGVRHLRLRGYPHTKRLRTNLWRDLKWSWRVWRNLPAADVTVVNSLALPVWLGWWRRRAGRLFVMPGRMPKGQYRWYRRIDGVLAVSSPVARAVVAENAALKSKLRIVGYPIGWTKLASAPHPRDSRRVTIGYAGRIHQEKGLDLLVAAASLLARRRDLPPWRLLLSGPSDVARGGSGADYARQLSNGLAAALPADAFQLLDPAFNEDDLARRYAEMDIFCYPSRAEEGETFGVAVAEAMAAGAVPVVSALSCFADFVQDGRNGIVFNHRAPDAAQRLADALAALIAQPDRRTPLGEQAQRDTERFDFPAFARQLLELFSQLK